VDVGARHPATLHPPKVLAELGLRQVPRRARSFSEHSSWNPKMN
jgi:hypothetical protein